MVSINDREHETHGRAAYAHGALADALRMELKKAGKNERKGLREKIQFHVAERKKHRTQERVARKRLFG